MIISPYQAIFSDNDQYICAVMHYLSVENLSKTFADKALFQHISFHISEGDKVALVALNGSGKSTLMRIIAGQEFQDEGTVWVHKDVNVIMLDQTSDFDPESTIAETILRFEHPVIHTIRAYELLMQNKEVSQEDMQLCISKMDEMNAWQFESVVHQVLDKLKISNLNQKISTLSGGERKRIALAKVLIELEFEQTHTLLLLDEPTNHLDLNMIEWLEHFLSKDKLTCILVTHDRYFLDTVCNQIMDLTEGSLFRVNGNYESYLEQKALREEQEQASIDKAKNRYRKELEWMRKQPRARTTKSKSRQDAFYEWQKKASQKIEHDRLSLSMKMSRLGGKIVELKKLYKSYNDKVILKGFDYTFKKGEHIGIVGKNGVGKSTFINIILGKELQDSGKINIGDTVVFGDFSQEGLIVEEDCRVIEYVKKIAEYFQLSDGTKLSATQFLQKFLFSPEKQYTYISKLSGGEKKRLQLLVVLYKNPNFLILDEPTNDLDLPTLDILEEFLQNFAGCLIIVSHDRYFMDKIVDHLFVFEGDGVITDFPGNYSQYRTFVREEEQLKTETQDVVSTAGEDKNTKDKSKRRSYNEQREMTEIEKNLPLLQKEKMTLEEKMSDTTLNYEKIQEMAERIQTLINQIDTMEMRWLEISEKES